MIVIQFLLSLIFSDRTLTEALKLRPNVLGVEVITMEAFEAQYRRWRQAQGPKAVPPLTDLQMYRSMEEKPNDPHVS